MTTYHRIPLSVYIVIISGLFLSTISMADTTNKVISTNKNSLASSESRGDNANIDEIIDLIKRNYNPIPAAKGTVQHTVVTITINANGDILQASASGADNEVNEAAKQAVLKTGNLPLDSSFFGYPTFYINFYGTTE